MKGIRAVASCGDVCLRYAVGNLVVVITIVVHTAVTKSVVTTEYRRLRVDRNRPLR